MSQFRKTPIATAVMMASGAGAALAQQTLPEVRVTAPPDEGYKTESSRSATRTDTPLRDIPQFINIVPQQVIRSQAATNFTDALRNVPGITYGAAEGGTQANNVFFLRGFPVVGDIFLDGVRDLGEYNRDLFAIDSVEVLKGPSALAFGRGSPGGVINQIPKYADLLTRKEVGVVFGSHGEKRATADVNLRMSDTSAFRLVALGEDSDIYRDTVEVKKLGFAPSLRFGADTDTDITLSYYYLRTDDVTDYGQPNLGATFDFAPPPVPLSNYYGLAKYDYTDHETQIATFKLDHRFNDALSLRETLRWASYKRQLEATIPTINKVVDLNGNPVTPDTPADLLLVNRQHDGGRTRDSDDGALINQTELTWRVATGAIKHTVLGGLELAREELNRKTYFLDADPTTAKIDNPVSTTPLINPDPFSEISYTKTPNLRIPAEAKTVALYGQDQVEFSKEWKALFGLRWERLESKVQSESAVTGAIAANGGPFSRTDNMWSGRLGVIWQPTDTQSYYVAAGNSYNPSGELGVYGGTGTNLTATNDDLKPEENRSYEIGSQWDIGGTQIRAALFRNEKINQRIPAEPDIPNAPTILGGERRVDGLELSAAGRLTSSWDIYGAFAWMNGEIVKSNAPLTEGKEPYGVPRTTGNFWPNYRLGGGWEIGGGAFASAGWWIDDQNRARAPSYVRWDATIAYVQQKYDIRVNVQNIFDEKYYVGGYQNAANRLIPGQPFTVLLSAFYRFD